MYFKLDEFSQAIKKSHKVYQQVEYGLATGIGTTCHLAVPSLGQHNSPS